MTTSPASEKTVAPRVRKDKPTREAEIVTAAYTVFVRDGYAQAKIDDIAAEASVSKGTVYIYYETKQALFEAVVRNYVLSSLEKIEGDIATGRLDHEAQLRFVIERAYAQFTGAEIRKIVMLLLAEGARFPELRQFYHDKVISRGRGIITKIVRDGIRAGAFRDVPIEDFPQIIMGPAMMGAIWRENFHAFSPIDLKGLCDAHVDMLLRGLRP